MRDKAAVARTPGVGPGRERIVSELKDQHPLCQCRSGGGAPVRALDNNARRAR